MGANQPWRFAGGGHALYQRYRCRDGDVVLVALEPKFAQAMAMLAGLPTDSDWLDPINAAALQSWLASCTCTELEGLAAEHDLPLVVCPEA